MKTALRTFVLYLGVSSAPLMTACDDRPANTSDVLAQDSTLNLAVMSPNQDTASPTELGGPSQSVDSLSVAMDSLAPAGPAPDASLEPTSVAGGSARTPSGSSGIASGYSGATSGTQSRSTSPRQSVPKPAIRNVATASSTAAKATRKPRASSK